MLVPAVAVGAAGVSPGDEVIVPPITMSATAMAPLFYGGIPRFVDIEQDYLAYDIKGKEMSSRSNYKYKTF